MHFATSANPSGAHAHIRTDARNVLDGVGGPAELGDNFLVGLLGEGRVRPGVLHSFSEMHRRAQTYRAHLMPADVLGLDHRGPRDGARSDDEKRGLERRVLLGKGVEKARGVRRRSVVQGQAKVHLPRQSTHVAVHAQCSGSS